MGRTLGTSDCTSDYPNCCNYDCNTGETCYSGYVNCDCLNDCDDTTAYCASSSSLCASYSGGLASAATTDTITVTVRAYTGSTDVASCTDSGSTTVSCSITGLTQQNCCWGSSQCQGAIAGDYYVESKTTHSGGTGSDKKTTQALFSCKGEGTSCSTDDECISLPGTADQPGDGKGHCVQKNANGDKVCRAREPWCGDQYCDSENSESCTTATRTTDIASCNSDPICKYYVCELGCDKRNLPANDYPNTFNSQNYPYPTDTWSCSYSNGDCSHCNGNGSCVSSCEDTDLDGYGLAHDLFHSDCCDATSLIPDCNDNPDTQQTVFGGYGKYIHPNDKSYGYLPSPYCDCVSSDGFSEGTYETYTSASSLPISKDLCYDNIDNNCDGPNDLTNSLNKIDCNDPNCRKSGYTNVSINPIRNRTCAGDCNSAYQTEIDYDRGCCPNPTDCVINEKCVTSGKIDGAFPDAYYCSSSKWYGGDTYSQICTLIVNDTNSATSKKHWNLTGNAGNGKCCGDDPNEYLTVGIYGDYACCNQSGMQVIGGECVKTLTTKYTWDGASSGYCLSDSQCLVNPSVYSFTATVANASDINTASNNKVRCINDAEFIGDHLCYNGGWTTRTAAIATQILSFSQSLDEGTLYCDSYDNILNNYDYSINSYYAENYFGTQSYKCKLGNSSVPCTNNICILQYNDAAGKHIVMGVSLNNAVNSNSYSILEALEGINSDCNSQLTSTSFASCGTGVFYDNKLKSIIYSKDTISLDNVLTGTWLSYMQGIYGSTLSYMSSKGTISSYDFSFASGTHDFNKIYIAKKGEKSIRIILEQINSKKYMSAVYSGFDTDVCSIINNFKSLQQSSLKILDCSTSGQNTYVITGGSSGYYTLLNDLGPKLRLG